ncbi:sensor histidine kinase [Hathewaya limosa]|uniref:Signal transduction histidine kinase n=1 Tax=Hathewaya limosa TaxID=1536 RepID=A0ABU0JRM7_HATLI|nr:sensor histidine kinase [Hathewaya limosa]MDQ0479750.1 signal transduction histidine kinase [Hathewaya limosa]
MEKIPFNVDAYTARLIGRENLSKVESAIIELVKNTYDADAGICFIYYEESTGTLYIGDNGSGMTKNIIEKHWMTIGLSSKVEKYISRKGRIQTGSKGIGRFALDRISSNCIMLTKNEKNTLRWIVNWEDFDERKKITDTYAEIEENNLTFDEFLSNVTNLNVIKLINKTFQNTGTIFKLTNLRDVWNDKFINKLSNNLSTLIPPDIEEIFKIYLFEESTLLNEAYIQSKFINIYDYKILFQCNEKGNINIKLYRNEFEFRDKFDEIMENAKFSIKDRNYFMGTPIIYNKTLLELLPGIDEELILNIGKFSGEIYFYKISSQKNEEDKYYYKSCVGRKNYAKQFGGIKIYRDGFRVRPYGESGTSNFDWLMLSERKTKSPAAISSKSGHWKVREAQIIGKVNISRLNVNLPDQANREGIVETKEFQLFKEALTSIINIFEQDRQYVIRKLSDMYNSQNDIEKFKIEINEKIGKYYRKDNFKSSLKNTIFNKDIKDILEDYKKDPNASYDKVKDYVVEVHKVKAVIDEKDEKIRDLEEENSLLIALATTGIVTNKYIHELRALSDNLFMDIVTSKESLEDIIQPKNLDERNISEDLLEVFDSIESAYRYKNKFNSWFKVTIDSVRGDRRKMKKWDIGEIIRNLTLSWEKVLSEKKISINFDERENIERKCFACEMESIIHNLITNSVSAFESVLNSCEKKIDIVLDEYNKGFIIEYKDNGKGLVESYKEDPYKILNSLETGKRDENGEKIGTGMGMWIIDEIVKKYNGSIDLKENISLKSGFKIRIIFENRIN